MRWSLVLGFSAAFVIAGLAWLGGRSISAERDNELQDAFFEEAPSRPRLPSSARLPMQLEQVSLRNALDGMR